jgi:hypothetical protein
MSHEANPYGLLCGPSPCDPGPLQILGGDISPWILLLFAAAAFVAGRQVRRTNVILPLFVLALTAAALLLRYEGKVALYHLNVTRTGDQAWLSKIQRETTQAYILGFLLCSAAPFGIGFLTSVARRRARNRSKPE